MNRTLAPPAIVSGPLLGQGWSSSSAHYVLATGSKAKEIFLFTKGINRLRACLYKGLSGRSRGSCVGQQRAYLISLGTHQEDRGMRAKGTNFFSSNCHDSLNSTPRFPAISLMPLVTYNERERERKRSIRQDQGATAFDWEET